MSWLNDLKVNDKVFAFFNGKGNGIYKVEKITTKHIVVNGVKFLKENGRIAPLKLYAGDKYSCIDKLTAEKEEEFTRGKIISFVKRELDYQNATKVPTAKLLVIYDLLKPEEK